MASFLTLLGTVFMILVNVFLNPGNFEEVYIGWKGLDRIRPSHHKELVSLYRCDNYISDSKNEEDPRYSTLSVRPGESTFLNDVDEPFRGLFQFKSPAGDDNLIACTDDTIYKAGGSSWTTLETGLNDQPWEGVLYDTGVTRLYLCNGWDKNKKYLAGRDDLLEMQNQDDQTSISGTVYFVASESSATCDATAYASIEVGQYIKPGTAYPDTDWVEVVSKESSNTLKFSSVYAGTTETVTSGIVRSNDVDNSRYMIEYAGHMVLGYTSIEASTKIGPNLDATPSYCLLRKAYGVAQSFEATSSNISAIRLRIGGAFQYQYPPQGNLIIKLKTNLEDTNSLAELIYPVSALPLNTDLVTFYFGAIPVVIGNTYYFTVERQTENTSPIQIECGSAYSNGSLYWTYNSNGFNSNWDVGVTTLEVTPSYTENLWFDYGDTYINEQNPTTNYNSAKQLFVGSSGGYEKKILSHSLVSYYGITNEAHPFHSVKLSMYKSGTGTGEVTVYRTLQAFGSTRYGTWNLIAPGISWGGKGATLEGIDYTTTDEVTTSVTSLSGYVTWELVDMSRSWTWDVPAYPVLISNETSGTIITFESVDASTNKAKWLLTTFTGSPEASLDLYFEILDEQSNRATINYSKRFKPENFPTLNTFDITGRIVGLAKTGGYLVVAGKEPDALHFYRYTGVNDDGFGIDYVTTIYGITFGSSKSIAYPPTDDSFLFYSGLGVYRQKGLQTQLLSGDIREEAKNFTDYRDPRDYYGGLADVMPQGSILLTKDTYLLAVPKTEAMNTYVYALNYANGVWSRWTGLYPTAMFVRESGGAEPRLYMGMQGGQAYTLDTSGSTTQTATIEWFFSKHDITKEKQLSYIDIWALADNPTTNCNVTLEVWSTDRSSTITSTSIWTEEATVCPFSTTTDEDMVWLKWSPNKKAREFRLRLRQKSDAGGLSLRSIRYKGKVLPD